MALSGTKSPWRPVLLDAVAKRGSGHTPDKKRPEYWNGRIKWLSLKDSDQLDNLYVVDTAERITPAGVANSSAVEHPAGTVVLSRDAGVGKSAITRDVMAVSQHFMAWQCGPALDNHFLYYWLQYRKPEFERIAIGNTIKTIGLPYFKNLEIPLPPFAEQRAIATALSDVDALLGALDQLIAKKRDIKEVTSQQLLTGETRLPGFSGKWREGRMADVIEALEAGVSVNSVEGDGAFGHEKCILKTSCVLNGRFIEHECKKISARDIARARLNPRGNTLLISRMNTPDLVGQCGYVDSDYPNLFVPDRLWMTRFCQNSDISVRWLSYLLSTPTFKRRIGAAATGTSGSMKNLSQHGFLALSVQFPRAAEQTAIANVLSDMDAELTAIEQRRDKTRLLKQGMMQELLTGRTRLV
ncbi:restriction endonuclease subunit S [Nannocystaceae bacterium ST9]